MSNNNLTKEAELIYDLICSVGSVTTSQVKRVLSNTRSNPENLVKSLCRMRYTKWIGENYSIPYYTSKINKGSIYCLWAMLDLISDENGNLAIEKLQNIIEGNGIVQFSYIQNDNTVVNMVYLTASDNAKVAASTQRFYDYSGAKKGEEKSAGIVYLFVTCSEEMAVKVKESNLNYPHKIAFLSGDIDNNPVIKFL